MISGDEAYGMADIVLNGFLRVVTHPRVFNPPSSMKQALAFVHDVRDQPNCVAIRAGIRRNWRCFGGPQNDHCKILPNEALANCQGGHELARQPKLC